MEPEKIESPRHKYDPKPMSFRQSAILTVKVLCGFGVLLALLWLGSELTAP